jgi:demethylmenaquinone methyltransferase/2-methoxy-6-polyprenyl-1,4-benzoquinol methylase
METRKKTLPNFKHAGRDKKEFVEKMFDDISPRYDFLNHFLSLGIDMYWRKIFVRNLNILDGQTILDVACGTGDIGFNILKQNKIELINIDLSKNMLDIAEKKAAKKNLLGIQFIQGDAEMLPLEDDSVDCLTIAYGFRNISHYEKALEEFHRVIKPGGILGILEFSIPKSRIFGSLFTFYFHHILPRIGSLFSRSDAYRYLPESVDFFPSRDDICLKINNAGFESSTFIDLTFGVSTIFLGQKSE